MIFFGYPTENNEIYDQKLYYLKQVHEDSIKLINTYMAKLLKIGFILLFGKILEEMQALRSSHTFGLVLSCGIYLNQ